MTYLAHYDSWVLSRALHSSFVTLCVGGMALQLRQTLVMVGLQRADYRGQAAQDFEGPESIPAMYGHRPVVLG